MNSAETETVPTGEARPRVGERPMVPVRYHPKPSFSRRLASHGLRVVGDGCEAVARRLAKTQKAINWFRLRYLEFVPRADDVFIATYPRSGTTWMQMILYQLTTDGDMDIPHINQHSPWFEHSRRWGRGFEMLPPPRVFKTHLLYDELPKGPCKYIYVARNGRDVAVSYYHLYRSHLGFRGTFDEFFDRFMAGKVDFGSWFDHVSNWWAQRDNPKVLLLRYEDLLRDLGAGVRRIIGFCELDLEPERIPAILERCSFTFMKKHEDQFDHLTGELFEQGKRLRSFLRHGRSEGWKGELSAPQQERFDEAYREQLAALDVDLGAPAALKNGALESERT